ncbi:MAG: acetate--CoA ligase family protein [Syntrophaceae bacterium]|nr:acetate--CoA ligase family protein [Syntrophaceae bacterium]
MVFHSNTLRELFYPRSIAVVGASADPIKIGHLILQSALLSRAQNVYPVHAGGAKAILGRPVYPTIEAIPDEEIDLFLFVVPQKYVLPGLEAAIKKGCKGAVIFTAGYRESGEGGEVRQEDLRKLAAASGIRIIGPNTLGFYRSHSAVNATFLPYLSEKFSAPGKITVVSQSGGVGAIIANQFMEDRLALGTLICVGNRLNVEFADVLDYCAEDPETETVALYIEGLEDVRTFYEAARRCACRKPVVVFHAGRTMTGRKTSFSHTGSMAASSAIYTGMFRQAGLVEVASVQEMADTVKCLSLVSPPAGNRVALVTHTAGPAIIATDILEQGGMTLPDLQEDTKTTLVKKKIVPPFIPVSNPVDLATAGTDRQAYLDVMETLKTDRNIDSILTVCVSLLGGQEGDPLYFPIETFKEKTEAAGKTSVMVWAAPVTIEEEFAPWERSGIPTYPTPERAARALVNLYRYGTMKQKNRGDDMKTTISRELINRVRDFQTRGISFVGEVEAKRWLTLAGINVVDTALAGNEDEALEHAAQCGYPVVMKIASERIVHKSDAGCVRLDLRNEEAVRDAYRQITINASIIAKPAEIQGVTVQSMIPEGFEVIIGGLRDPQAGPVVMFGLGGIWVEAMNEVAFRLAPVSREEAAAMVTEIRGAALLFQGGRGRHPVNREVLLDLIVIASHLMAELPLAELDLNPVIFYDDRYAVADARILIQSVHDEKGEVHG